MEQINVSPCDIIATATYQAILSPLGGISSGTYKRPYTRRPLGVGLVQMDKFNFVLFMSVNAIAFLSSMAIIWLLLCKTNNSLLLKVSLFFLFASYGIGLTNMAFELGSKSYCILYLIFAAIGISFVGRACFNREESHG